MAMVLEFDPFSDQFFEDPYDVYRRLRDEAPVYHNERYGFWALSRFADVLAAHRDFDGFSSAHGVTLEQLTDEVGAAPIPESMIMMDPPGHDRLRKLVSRAFTPKAAARFEPVVRDVAVGYLDRMEGRDRFDIVEELAAPFPVEVISAILGVPAEDRQQIRHQTDLLLHREPGNPNTTAAGMEAGMAQGLYFYELAQEKRKHPGDDMITVLCQTSVERDDGGMTELTDAEIAGFAGLLAAAGSETVTKLIGSAAVLFARNPKEWQKVVADPAGKAPMAVEEVLRYWPPSQYQGRFSTRDVTFEGGTIPADSAVLLLTGAATRDPREYDEPDTFDIDRKTHISVAFGHGIHACIGAHLARLESRFAIEELARRWPRFAVDESGLRRVHMANVAGYTSVPVIAGG
jgi:cytochrome P450